VRAVGLVENRLDIEQTVITTKNGTPLRSEGYRRGDAGTEDPAGHFAKAIHKVDGHIVDNDDVVSGIALLRKAPSPMRRSTPFTTR